MPHLQHRVYRCRVDRTAYITAFYNVAGVSTAYTGQAAVDRDRNPAPRVEDPLDGSGLLMHGPWVLTRYDPKWRFAKYERPAGWDAESPEQFNLAPGQHGAPA